MTDLVKVYSPAGEMFENSPANARDLVTHVGWTYEKPSWAVITEVATPAVIEEEIIVTEEVSENVLADQAEEETEKSEASEEASDEQDEEVKASTRGRKKKV